MTPPQQAAWQVLGQELGSPVLALILGQALTSSAGVPAGEWGMYILTESALHYRHDPSQGVLAGMIKIDRADQPRLLGFNRSEVLACRYHQGTFWKRLFAGENDFITLEWSNGAPPLSFEPLEGGEAWAMQVNQHFQLPQKAL